MQHCSTFVNYWKCFFFPSFFWVYQNFWQHCGACETVTVDLTSRIYWGRRCRAQAAIAARIQRRRRAGKQRSRQIRDVRKNSVPAGGKTRKASCFMSSCDVRVGGGCSLTGTRAAITFQFSFICIASGTISFNKKEEVLGVGPKSMITAELTPRKDEQRLSWQWCLQTLRLTTTTMVQQLPR